MRAGKLRHRVDIQEVSKTRTVEGGFTDSWTQVAPAWVQIQPGPGREFFENQSVVGEMTHKITARGEVEPHQLSPEF